MGNGTDDFGFGGLATGNQNSATGFYDVGKYGYWWSATEYDTAEGNYRYMRYDSDHFATSKYDKLNAFSVRCVQD